MNLTPRKIYDQIVNTLDFLENAGLVAFKNTVRMVDDRIAFNTTFPSATPFILDHNYPTIDQYKYWVRYSAYSAYLFDGSLLQFDYTVKDGAVVAHRLAYVPCPYNIDYALVRGGDGLLDIIELYEGTQAPLLRSPIRIDFDPVASKQGHPDVHMTLNGSTCRIACVAPVHVLRFVDFIFEHFYPAEWLMHEAFFGASRTSYLGKKTIRETELEGLHMAWRIS